MMTSKRAARRAVLVLSMSVAMVACSDDDPVIPPCSNCGDMYQEPVTREAVLNNLEVAYNNRAIAKYSEILDANFTMYFSSADVLSGKTPDQWGRADEIDASRNLFDRAYTDTDPSDGIQPRCVGVSMDVRWEDGVQWQEIEPASAPEEKWYTATVYYNFQFDIEGDLHLINNQNSKAQFTVRNAGTDSAPHWQLVEMRDLNSSSTLSASSSSTEQSTWGQIKTLYRP